MSSHTVTWKTKVKYIVFSIYGKDDDIRWTILLNKVFSKSFLPVPVLLL